MNDRIVIDPMIRHGKPVIRGTRVPVSIILGALAGGDEMSQVAEDYGVTLEDIRAAIDFANRLVEQEDFHLMPV